MTTTPATAKQPQDHKPKTDKRRAEATNRLIEFDWGGDSWAVEAQKATDMGFFAALADAQDENDPIAMVRALRVLLGREQADRLCTGRSVDDIEDFFTAAGEAVGTGNR